MKEVLHQITIEEYMEMVKEQVEALPKEVIVSIEGFKAVVEVVADIIEYIQPEKMEVDRTVSWGWVARVEDMAESCLKLARRKDYPLHVRKDMYMGYIRRMCSIEYARHIENRKEGK